MNYDKIPFISEGKHMLFNRNFERLKFSTDQYLTEEKKQEILGDYKSLSTDMLHADIKDINSRMYGIEQDEDKVNGPMGKIIGACLVLAFISAAVCLILRNMYLFGFIMSGMLAIVGILCMLGLTTDTREHSNQILKSRMIGFPLFASAIAILLILIFRSHFSNTEIFMWIIAIAFGFGALWLIPESFLDKFSGKIIYKEEVDAKVIGYVRKVDAERPGDSSSSHRTRRLLLLYESPVFSYIYGGRNIEAYYDDMVQGTDSDIPMGSTVRIKIDPKNPDRVMSPVTINTAGFFLKLLFGIISAVIAIGIACYTLNPNTDLSGSSSKRYTNDELIEENLSDYIDGQEWYVEEARILKVEEDDTGILITFYDSTFREVYNDSGETFEAGDFVLVFYTVDDNRLATGKNYKKPFMLIDPEVTEYYGSHTAYEG